MGQASESSVLAALSGVMDPELNIDIVKAGMVKDLRLDGNRALLKVELTTPACPMKDKIQKDVEAALKAVPGLESFDVQWGAKVRGKMQSSALGNGLAQVKNVVLVGAGKGGVGKSTVALNLAVGLAKHGAKAGLLDADFYGPSIPTMTGLRQRPVSADGKTLDPLLGHGIKVMSFGVLIEPDQALIWRGPMLAGALKQMLYQVNWGDLDYLVVDLPPGTGDVPLTLAQDLKAAGAVLVSTPQDVALADVIRAKKMFDQVNVPILGLVENMSQFICPHCQKGTAIFDTGGGQKASSFLGIDLLGQIPLELKIRQGGDAGLPVILSHPDSPEAKAFLELATVVAGKVSRENARSVSVTVSKSVAQG